MPASIFPCWMAAMNVLPAPTGTSTNSPIFTPFRTARYWVRKLVDDPSPVTPRFLPLKSAARQLVRDFRRDELHLARRLAELHDRFDELALGLQVDGMVVEAD